MQSVREKKFHLENLMRIKAPTKNTCVYFTPVNYELMRKTIKVKILKIELPIISINALQHYRVQL